MAFNKNVLLGFMAMATLQSCMETRFKEPQPIEKREKSSFPKSIQGLYMSDDGDSVFIENDHISGPIGPKNTGTFPELQIGDSLKIKKYKKRIFVNLLDKKNYWNVALIDYSSKGHLHVYYIDPKSPKTKDLRKITKVEEYKNDKGKTEYLLLNPSKSEWKQIIKQEIPEILESYRKIE